MARVKIEEIIDYLDTDIKSALSDAISQVIPEAEYDKDKLFREFKLAVERKCNTWENVPDRYVEK